jgi:hypothetical protein
MTKPNGKPPTKPTLVKATGTTAVSDRKLSRQFRIPKHGGGKLQIGNPGPRDTSLKEFRRACAEALKDPILWDRLNEDLHRAGAKGAPMRILLFKIQASYAHGMPRQSLEVTGRDGGPVELAAVRESLARKILGPQPQKQA